MRMAYWDVIETRWLAWPTDWNTTFGRTAPLVLEIGFGRGGHLIHLGKTQPDNNIIGIEISRPSLKKASRKTKANRLDNVRVVCGSGVTLLWYMIAPQTLDALYINFPDPWHKERHNGRQIINDDFLHLAATRMKPYAPLYIATDHPDYQPVVTNCLERTPYFHSRMATTYTTIDNTRFRTKYEQKALDEGRVPFYYKWKRNTITANAPDAYPIPQEQEMPHAVIHLPRPLEKITPEFTPFRIDDVIMPDGQSINVRFLGLYRRSDGDRAFFIETYINEQPFDQRIALNVSARNEPDHYLIQLHRIGFPRSTTGAHIAVGALANWLVGLEENGRIVHHNLQPPP